LSYIGLGSRLVAATADQTGLNSGNYTCAFTPAIIAINMPFFEVYKMFVQNVPVGFAASIAIDNKYFSYTVPYAGSEWDPSQPMNLIPGNELDFLWNIPVTNPTVPEVTAWFRYDPGIPANARFAAS
jgi:hypothetical protein